MAGYQDAWTDVPGDFPGLVQKSNFGSENFNILRNIIAWSNILKNNIGAEIGTFQGDTSFNLLVEFPSLTLYSVDPWDKYEEYGEYDRPTLSENEQLTRKRLRPFGDRSRIIKDFSSKAVSQFEDGSLDFVFIDGNHDYEYVREDIELWYPKIRPGGLFSGHDYNWDGVMRAVHEFSAKMRLAGFVSPVTSDVWYFLKPESDKRKSL